MVLMECGHHKEAGLTLPMKVLEARGLVNAKETNPDPRIKRREGEALRLYYMREYEKIYKLLMGVSHWMDSLGGIHINPCYKQTVRKISNYASLKMNHEEMMEIYKGIHRMLAYLKTQRTIGGHEEEISALQNIAGSTGGREKIISRKIHLQENREGRPTSMGVQVERKNIYIP